MGPVEGGQPVSANVTETFPARRELDPARLGQVVDRQSAARHMTRGKSRSEEKGRNHNRVKSDRVAPQRRRERGGGACDFHKYP